MPITTLSPTQGAPGADIEIRGSGFTGATRVLFGTLAAAMIVVSDILIRATVPPDATTSGLITVETPTGDLISTSQFTVLPPRVSIAPEFSAKGREAMNALVLAMAAKARGDRQTVLNAYSKEVVFAAGGTPTVAADGTVMSGGGSQFSVANIPQGAAATSAEVVNYEQRLYDSMPTTFSLRKMLLSGDAVFMQGTANNGELQLLLRRGAHGYQIVVQTNLAALANQGGDGA